MLWSISGQSGVVLAESLLPSLRNSPSSLTAQISRSTKSMWTRQATSLKRFKLRLLVLKYGILSNRFLNLGCGQMPTFMAFKGGNMIGKSLGADPRKLEVRTYTVLDDKWLINTLQALIQDVNKLNAEN